MRQAGNVERKFMLLSLHNPVARAALVDVDNLLARALNALTHFQAPGLNFEEIRNAHRPSSAARALVGRQATVLRPNFESARAHRFVGLQPTVIASRAPHLLLEQSVMTLKIQRIVDVHRPSSSTDILV